MGIKLYPIGQTQVNPVSGGLVRAPTPVQPVQVDAFTRTLSAIAEDKQKRVDADAVRRAMAEYNTRSRDFLYGEKGLYNRKGLDSQGVTTEATRWTAEQVTAIGNGLSERQREQFFSLASNATNSTLNGLARYESSEFKTAELDSYSQFANSAIDAVGDMAHVGNFDQRALDARYKEGVEAARQIALAKGLNTDQVEREYTEKFHEAVVMGAMTNHPDQARAYFKAHSQDISKEKRAVLDEKIQTVGALAYAQQAADNIMSQYGDDPEAAMDAARTATKDPEKRKALEAMVASRVSQANAAKSLKTQQSKDDLSQAIYQSGGDLNVIAKDPALMAQFADLSGMDQQAIEDFAIKVKTPVARTTNQSVYDNYVLQRESGSLDEMTYDKFFETYHGGMDPTTLESAWNKVKERRKAPGATEIKDTLTQVLRENNYYKDDASGSDKNLRELRQARLQAHIERWKDAQEKLQKPITPDDIVAESERYIKSQVRLDGFIGTKEVPVIEVPAGRDNESSFIINGTRIFVNSDTRPAGAEFVPPEWRRKITDRLRAKGVQPLPEQIARMYYDIVLAGKESYGETPQTSAHSRPR